MEKTNQSNIQYAFVKSIPVMCGYIFLGIAFGILLQESGYSAIWALLISLLVYAGSLQFVMVPMLVGCVSPLTMAVTTLFVNCRHIFYGISFVESFKKMKHRLYMIFSLTDETYSVLCSCKNEDPEETRRDTWFLISAINHSYWVIGSVFGAWLGDILPFDFTGIDFSMTALFIVILIEQVLGKKVETKIAAFVGLFTAAACLLIFGADRFLLSAMLLTVLFLTIYTSMHKDVEITQKEGEVRD